MLPGVLRKGFPENELRTHSGTPHRIKVSHFHVATIIYRVVNNTPDTKYSINNVQPEQLEQNSRRVSQTTLSGRGGAGFADNSNIEVAHDYDTDKRAVRFRLISRKLDFGFSFNGDEHGDMIFASDTPGHNTVAHRTFLVLLCASSIKDVIFLWPVITPASAFQGTQPPHYCLAVE